MKECKHTQLSHVDLIKSFQTHVEYSLLKKLSHVSHTYVTSHKQICRNKIEHQEITERYGRDKINISMPIQHY